MERNSGHDGQTASQYILPYKSGKGQNFFSIEKDSENMYMYTLETNNILHLFLILLKKHVREYTYQKCAQCMISINFIIQTMHVLY